MTRKVTFSEDHFKAKIFQQLLKFDQIIHFFLFKKDSLMNQFIKLGGP